MDNEAIPTISPQASIVILNWYGADDALACLDSTPAPTYANFNVIVVDNGSTDDSRARLHPYTAIYPLTPIETGRNLGIPEARRALYSGLGCR